ncbi:MAG: PLP-dependent aminotransferase family protein, partial [Peptococcales bacterium]
MLEFSCPIIKDSATPIYLQLYDYIKGEITAGRIEPQTKLPSIRRLAEYLKISRTTVETTYHQLLVEGYIDSKPKSGYFVNNIANNMFAATNKLVIEEVQREKKFSKPMEYDFRNDYIDRESFDFNLWRKFLNKALLTNSERFLTYGSHQGEYELRVQLTKYVHQSRGVICQPEQIVIGSGVQSLLNILCGMLKPYFRRIGFEEPGFKHGRHIFKDHSFSIIPIKLDDDGINIDSLAASEAEIVYVSPSHQFPMGSVMPIGKRVQLLNWAHAREGLIIEDDYDSELRYSGRPVPSLQGLSKGSRVIYLGTFSKILLPSIRISFMVLPENILPLYQQGKEKYNQTSSQIEQIALALFMQEGMLEKHIRRLRKIYARKNQLLIETIEKIMKDRVKVQGSETGLHILLELCSEESPEIIRSLAEQVGVKVIPLSNYFLNDSENKKPLVLLSYGGIPIDHIEPAIKLLKRVWFK